MDGDLIHMPTAAPHPSPSDTEPQWDSWSVNIPACWEGDSPGSISRDRGNGATPALRPFLTQPLQ